MYEATRIESLKIFFKLINEAVLCFFNDDSIWRRLFESGLGVLLLIHRGPTDWISTFPLLLEKVK